MGTISVIPTTASTTLKDASEAYLQFFMDKNRPRSYESAQQIIREYANRQPGGVLFSATGWQDVDRHIGWLRDERGHCPRTLANKFIRLSAFYRKLGVNIPSDLRPRFQEEEPTVYEPHELAKFFTCCLDIHQTTLFKVLLTTGIRKEEARWLQWTDLEKHMLHIQPHMPNFAPKNYECRWIPVPNDVWSLLMQMPRKSPVLVFPTASGLSDPHMLRAAKRIARRAGMNPENFELHKFRRTYLTTCLRKGIDLRTVQKLAGHRNIQSTMRYLRGMDAEKLVGRMSEIFA